jgi:acetyl-CoA synthetase
MISDDLGSDRPDYNAVYSAFSFETAASRFAGNFKKGINACIECCDRYEGQNRTAIIYKGPEGFIQKYSFDELAIRAAQFANLLTSHGIKRGDRVACLLSSVPEMIIVLLGAWRAGAVYQPLFTGFGPKAIEHRLRESGARCIVTSTADRKKLDEMAGCPLTFTVNAGEDPGQEEDFWSQVDRQSSAFDPVMLGGADLLLLMFTSGTTGLPKGVPVPVKSLGAIWSYIQFGADLRPGEIYWNMTNPGWAYGLYAGVIGPLLVGEPVLFLGGTFSVQATYNFIDELGVTNFAAAPTAFRMMIGQGPQAAAKIKGKLRAVSSAGEPMNPEVCLWFKEHVGCSIRDHYGQTEVAMPLLNHHGLRHPQTDGPHSRSLPGFRMVVVDEEGHEVPPNTPGILAVDIDESPLHFFDGYWQQDTKPNVGKYYLTGDIVKATGDGGIWFVGRDDDIITSSGYRIGPFDVESSLMEHKAVLEVCVIGKPDPLRTEIVKAFIVLKPGAVGTTALKDELQLIVKRRLAAHSFPREIEFVSELPKTQSGKVQRFVLRERERKLSQRGDLAGVGQ